METKKLVIAGLGALLVAGTSGVALADAHGMDDGSMSDLEAAFRPLAGGSNDIGWDALTPRTTEAARDADLRTVDLDFAPYVRREDIGDLEDDLGNMEVDRAGMDLRLDYTDEGGHLWAFRWGWEESDYDVADSPVGSGVDDALDGATSWSLSMLHQRRIDDHWGAFGGIGVTYAGVDGASFGDGRNFMGSLGGTYVVQDDLTVGLGVIVKEDFDDSAEFLPIPLVTYRLDDRTIVRMRGPRIDVAHRVDDRITLRALAEMEARSYRLDNNDPSAPDGALNDSHALVGFGLDFAANDWFMVRGEIGMLFAQEYELEDDDGSKLATVDGDDKGWFVGLEAILMF